MNKHKKDIVFDFLSSGNDVLKIVKKTLEKNALDSFCVINKSYIRDVIREEMSDISGNYLNVLSIRVVYFLTNNFTTKRYENGFKTSVYNFNIGVNYNIKKPNENDLFSTLHKQCSVKLLIGIIVQLGYLNKESFYINNQILEKLFNKLKTKPTQKFSARAVSVAIRILEKEEILFRTADKREMIGFRKFTLNIYEFELKTNHIINNLRDYLLTCKCFKVPLKRVKERPILDLTKLSKGFSILDIKSKRSKKDIVKIAIRGMDLKMRRRNVKY